MVSHQSHLWDFIIQWSCEIDVAVLASTVYMLITQNIIVIIITVEVGKKFQRVCYLFSIHEGYRTKNYLKTKTKGVMYKIFANTGAIKVDGIK